MRRGTTPTIILKISNIVDLSTIDELWVTFKSMIHERTYTKEECVIDNEDSSIKITMSQEDTLGFSTGDARVQIRFTIAGTTKAYASNIKSLNIEEILKEGVIGGTSD